MRQQQRYRRPRPAPGWILTALALAVALVSPGRAEAQTGTVTGRVVEAGTLAPIAGAQVFIVDTNLSALTEANGRYVLANVPAGTRTIRIVHIGFRPLSDQTVEVRAGATTSADFELAAATINLDEIVVTGTGAPTQRRQLGQTISSVTSEELQQAPIANATDALRGRVPGLVSNSMGETGSSARIRLRSTVSLSQRNEPIIYIDGVRVDNSHALIPGTNVSSSRLDDLNAGDIDRIEVIKGAAAATLYGTEASSGVIQIFTKRGQAGEPTYTFEVSQHAFTTPESRIPRNFAYSFAEREIASNFPASDFLRTGYRQDYSLSLRGGSTATRYFVSGRYMDETGTLPTNELSNWSGRVALDFDHTDRLTSKVDVSVIRNSLRAPQPNWGLVGEFVLANPWNVDENRPYGELFTTVPGALAYKNTQDATTTTLSGTLGYAWLENMESRLTVGYNKVDTETILSIPVGAGLRDPDGLRDIFDRGTSNITVDFSTNLTMQLSDRLSSTTTFGGQSFWETMVQQRTGVRNFPAPALNTLRGGSTVFAVDEFQEEVINAGFYVQQQLGLDNRLFLTAGVRMDGNSAFGENFGLETYPKVGASWVVSDEDFWSFDGFGFDLLRLRGAYGTSGLQPGAFDAQRTWRPAALVNNQAAVLPENLGNPDLKPERSTEIEAAAELGFGDGRLSFEFVYWNQKTTDALLPVQGSPSNGFLNTQLTNIGSLESSGIELSGNVSVLSRPDLGWDLDAAVTTVDQVVADMGGVPSFRLTSGRRYNRIQEGYAPGAILAPIADPANPYSVAGPVEDLTRLNQITPNFLKNAAGEDSLVYIGDSQPTWTVNVGSTLRLGQSLTLRTLFTGEGGFIMSNETGLIRAAINLTETAANFARELDDPSTSAERRAEIADLWGRKHPNVISAWMEDADYLRWSELTATYAVPEGVFGRLGFGHTTLSVGVRNLAIWTKYSGLNDPGTTTNNVPAEVADLVPNIDYFGAPVPRRLVFTLRTTR